MQLKYTINEIASRFGGSMRIGEPTNCGTQLKIKCKCAIYMLLRIVEPYLIAKTHFSIDSMLRLNYVRFLVYSPANYPLWMCVCVWCTQILIAKSYYATQSNWPARRWDGARVGFALGDDRNLTIVRPEETTLNITVCVRHTPPQVFEQIYK